MKTEFVAVLFIVLAAGAAAHVGHVEHDGANASVESVSSILESPEEFTSAYNENADQLPSLVKSLVSGERINVRVEREDGEVVIGLLMDGARVEEVQEGGVDDPSVEFFTDKDTLQSVLTAENTGKAAVDAFNGDGIRYQAHGLGSTVKFAVVSTLSKVLGAIL